ncbi:MAG: AAA family ATPase [Planctomycetes bacterium]|nr:AAA family ATPase [Planctomycetota bacterium]
MRFTELELRNWKNFTDVKVKLARRVFIVGPNASGKSNFLDVFRFLRDLVTEGGGLVKSVEVREGISKVRSLYARGPGNDVAISCKVRSQDGTGWDYELGFRQRNKDPRPFISWETVSRVRGDARPEKLLSRPDDADRKDLERLTQTAIQQVTANQQFRELADFFRSISYLHLVPQLVREAQAPNSRAIGEDQLGRDLLDRIRATTPRRQKQRLKRIQEALKVVAPQFDELNLETDSHGRPHLTIKFRHWRPPGAIQRETQFSDGTLRIIGLLWALQERTGPLLLEEPELTLHTAIVRRLAPFLYRAQKANHGRQVLLSTHSVDLLSDEGISADEILLIQPGENGSTVTEAASNLTIRRLMEASIPASQAVLSHTETSDMPLFDSVGI